MIFYKREVRGINGIPLLTDLAIHQTRLTRMIEKLGYMSVMEMISETRDLDLSQDFSHHSSNRRI